MTVDLDRVEELTDRVEESFPRRPDEPMTTWARRAFGEGYLNRDELDTLVAFCATEVPDGPAAEPDDSDAPDEPRFALVNAQPRWVPWKPDAPERKRQRTLLTGLDCLPGQGDLFAVDGEYAD